MNAQPLWPFLFEVEIAHRRSGRSRTLFVTIEEDVRLINLGCDSFVRWWEGDPTSGAARYRHWHSYQLKKMSAGYFMSNVIAEVTDGFTAANDRLWFPVGGKEARLVDRISFRAAHT